MQDHTRRVRVVGRRGDRPRHSVAYGIPRQELQGLPAPALRTRYNTLYFQRHKNGRSRATPDVRWRSAPVVPLPKLPVDNQPAGSSTLATPTGGAPAATAAVNTLADSQPAGPSTLATPTGGAPAATAAVNTPADTAPVLAVTLSAQVPVATYDAVAPVTGTAHAPTPLVRAAAAALTAAARGAPARPPEAPLLPTHAASGVPVETLYSTASGGVVGTANTVVGVRASQGPGPAFMEGEPGPANLTCVWAVHGSVEDSTERRLAAENAAAVEQLAIREVLLREASSRKMDEECFSTEEEDVTGDSGGSTDESDGDS